MTKHTYNTNLFPRAYSKRAQSSEGPSPRSNPSSEGPSPRSNQPLLPSTLQLKIKESADVITTVGGLILGAGGALGAVSFYRSRTPPPHRKSLVTALSGLGGFTAGHVIGSFITSHALDFLLGVLNNLRGRPLISG